jgi:uncharacterized protein (TIGR03000 family)
MYGVVFAALLAPGFGGQIGSPYAPTGPVFRGCYGGVPVYAGCPVGGVVYPAGGFPIILPAMPAGGKGGTSPSDSSDAKEGSPQDLLKLIGEVRKERERRRVEALERAAGALKQQALEQQIEEIRRALERMKGGALPAGPPLIPLPPPRTSPELPPPKTGMVELRVPKGATLEVNGRPLEVRPSFLTPAKLEPGQEGHYDFRVTVARGEATDTRTHRVAVRAGEVVRLAFDDMLPPKTGMVELRVPEGATLEVNGRPLEVRPSFLTPAKLEPGQEGHYDFRVTVARGEATDTRTHRVAVRAGEVVRLAFEDMRPAGGTAGAPGIEG